MLLNEDEVWSSDIDEVISFPWEIIRDSVLYYGCNFCWSVVLEFMRMQIMTLIYHGCQQMMMRTEYEYYTYSQICYTIQRGSVDSDKREALSNLKH